jgi:hypothetical protein
VTFYDVLGFPLIYKAAQVMLAPGMKQIPTGRLRKAVAVSQRVQKLRYSVLSAGIRKHPRR